MSAPFTAYIPPGPVAARFAASDAFIRAIMGPVGSGKTGACLMQFLHRGMVQAPHPANGVRRTKWAVIRDTYRQLEKTTIPSWHHWVPKELGNWVGGSGGQPARHTVAFALPDGTTAEIIVEFIGLGDNAAADVMPGWEGTGAYLNEADKLSPDTLTFVSGRVGRYPAVERAAGFAGATWRGLWLDFNAPDVDHWLYDKFVENRPEKWELFVQPGGVIEEGRGRWVVNPRAENLANLPAGYYDQQIDGQPLWYIRRMAANKWGATRDGLPVYEEYSDDMHLAPRLLEPVPGIPLMIAVDAGNTPAGVIGQKMQSGQVRLLDELVTPPGEAMGAQRFGQALLSLLQERYPWWVQREGLLHGRNAPSDPGEEPMIVGVGDPASDARSNTDEEERSWLQILSATTRIKFRKASTNAFLPRIEGVRGLLTQLVDGEPMMLVSPRCKTIRRGFNSGYRFPKKATESQPKDRPEKNHWSHVHDAVQYLADLAGAVRGVMGRAPNRNTAALQRQTRAISEDAPTGEWQSPRDYQRQSHAID